MASDHIEIVKYDPSWPSRAQEEIIALRKIFDQASFSLMEHIGSTSVPGLDAKPVIDIVIACKNIDEVKAHIPAMEKRGYVFWQDAQHKDHFLFIKGLPPHGAGRTHHVHLYPEGHEQITEHIDFRDKLRADPVLAKAYQDLKYDLAAKYRDDRDGYTEAKTEFIKKVISLVP
ncbi:MAG: GrpB family protein [Rhodospirillales bacterium]|nr:GrpB family protein [Rhodospirillales bacterium]MCB9995653.1 GrpB family protein [Rhodospirillales bacterium]